MMSPKQGAATSVWATVAKVWEGKGGKDLSNCEVGPPLEGNDVMFDGGFAKHAYDPQGEDRLWEVSAKFVGA
jgi:hypothetical protein